MGLALKLSLGLVVNEVPELGKIKNEIKVKTKYCGDIAVVDKA